jgi:hypothetical protein
VAWIFRRVFSSCLIFVVRAAIASYNPNFSAAAFFIPQAGGGP